MEFFRRTAGQPNRLAVFPGTFNPVTVAHIALAKAALAVTDEVLFVLPRSFPHKTYTGATFAERVELLGLALEELHGCSIASSDGGLFVEIAAECRREYPESAFSFLCGRDAAERIVRWNYGGSDKFSTMLRQFDFLVAARGGEYRPPAHQQESFTVLELANPLDHISASEIRRRISLGEDWEDLVPRAVQHRVREIYRPANPTAPAPG